MIQLAYYAFKCTRPVHVMHSSETVLVQMLINYTPTGLRVIAFSVNMIKKIEMGYKKGHPRY